MRRPIHVRADGIGHPEGPDVLPDGRIVFVATYTSDVMVHRPGTAGAERFAYCGGGTNACVVGSDGAVYVTQNGGTAGAWKAEHQVAPSIQRINPDLSVDFVVVEVDGDPLHAPNDLAFGPDGRLYFTDPGEWDPDTKPTNGRIIALDPDGTPHVVEAFDEPRFPNGIVVEPDGSLVWVESYTRQVRRRRPDGTIEDLAELPEPHIPDGLKVDVDGNLWITNIFGGGVDVVAADGTWIDMLECPYLPLNCTFVGMSLWVTDLGDTGGITAEAPMVGRLLEVEVGIHGQQVARGSVAGTVDRLSPQ